MARLRRCDRSDHEGRACLRGVDMAQWKDEIRRRLASLKLAPARGSEIVEEVSQHLKDRFAELRAGGATEEDADRAVLAELSEVDLLARELRRVESQVRYEPVVLGATKGSIIK